MDVINTAINDNQLYKADVIARLFNVTTRRIQQLTQDGVLPTVKPGGRGRRGYELVPTIQAYVQHLSDKAKGKAANKDEEELKKQKLQAEIKLKNSQYELHQLKNDLANGKYLPLADVREDYQLFFTTFKKFAQAMPARLITQVAGYVEPAEARALEKSLNIEVASMLRTFVVAAQGDDG